MAGTVTVGPDVRATAQLLSAAAAGSHDLAGLLGDDDGAAVTVALLQDPVVLATVQTRVGAAVAHAAEGHDLTLAGLDWSEIVRAARRDPALTVLVPTIAVVGAKAVQAAADGPLDGLLGRVATLPVPQVPARPVPFPAAAVPAPKVVPQPAEDTGRPRVRWWLMGTIAGTAALTTAAAGAGWWWLQIVGL